MVAVLAFSTIPLSTTSKMCVISMYEASDAPHSPLTTLSVDVAVITYSSSVVSIISEVYLPSEPDLVISLP